MTGFILQRHRGRSRTLFPDSNLTIIQFISLPTMLTATQERKALALLEREERKEQARVKLYAELRAKRRLWSSK